MSLRQPLPHLWLFTDERQGDGLWTALDRLPRGAGIVFRHYSLPPVARRGLFRRICRLAKRRQLVVVVAGAQPLRADGAHGRRVPGLQTRSVHNVRELRQAERDGASCVFLSPIFPTRSHPGSRTLGPVRFGLIARQARIPVLALGGVTPANARRLPLAWGWAAIDAWSR